MKKTVMILIVFFFIGIAAPLLATQAQTQEQTSAPEQDVLGPLQKKSYTYNPLGRRDPFKDLLTGKDIKEKSFAGGLTQMSIDDINLIGIVKSRDKLTGIVTGPQGFPYYVKPGDKFADGYVLSINEAQVVLRKINERGIPLMRPKDVIKEISTEER